MADRFSAFTFVDAITEFEPGRRAAGRFLVPAHLAHFRPPLVAEAIGQLAAWIAMEQFAFGRRPVAGIAGLLRYPGTVVPGQTLDVSVRLDSCDEDAVAYAGRACVAGRPVVELENIVGPMLGMEEFDSPDAVRADFATLRGPGAPPGRVRSLPEPDMTVTGEATAAWVEADLRVPASGAFFGDHFPRRPVFPGTLLLDAQVELALGFAKRAGFGRPRAVRSLDSKIRAFMPPGTLIKLRLERLEAEDGGTLLAGLSGRVDGKTVTTGRLEIMDTTEQAQA
jgi:3-hydroxymyristoyl/3-hydroxydecanoyl-(acyl carrier protein) dehydratase